MESDTEEDDLESGFEEMKSDEEESEESQDPHSSKFRAAGVMHILKLIMLMLLLNSLTGTGASSTWSQSYRTTPLTPGSPSTILRYNYSKCKFGSLLISQVCSYSIIYFKKYILSIAFHPKGDTLPG